MGQPCCRSGTPLERRASERADAAGELTVIEGVADEVPLVEGADVAAVLEVELLCSTALDGRDRVSL